jgi:glyoxylase-like metal-dependent hydrolase (beta-lactamase superfamily II)
MCLATFGLMSMFGDMSAAAQTTQSPIHFAQNFPYDPARQHNHDFHPSGSFKQLSEHIYVYDDTCKVYAILKDHQALLVGFGSGGILAHLKSLGIPQVDQVLLTHHHREQAQGLCNLHPIPFQVVIPERESVFFENVDSFWKSVRLYINYDCRSHWNTLRQSIQVSRKVKAGDVIPWNGYLLKVLETPGHTDHSISYMAEIDGKRVVFCGDLISGPGRVPNWFDLHWDYYGFTQGIDASEKAFERIKAEKPDLLLPSSGDPIDRPDVAVQANRRLYATLREMLVPNELHRIHQEVRQILPHLVFVGANSYAILSDSGKAFLWDYGYVERGRIEELKEKFKVKQIDVLSFSHYHDDHIIRAWELLQEDTQFWVYENMKDIFENPIRYRLPCLIPFAIRVDKVLHHEQKVQWEEYAFEFYHLPGQTEFHQGLSTLIDGRKVMFTGDNTWNKEDPGKTRNGPLVPQNVYFLDGGFISCAQTMIDYSPDLVCPAHTEEYSPARRDLEEFKTWAYRLREVMTELVDQPDPNFGVDSLWCHFYPYRTVTTPGQDFTLELHLRNHLFKEADVQVMLKLPAEIECGAPKRNAKVPPKTEAVIPFLLQRTAQEFLTRRVITADVIVDGCHIGEYAEALVD